MFKVIANNIGNSNTQSVFNASPFVISYQTEIISSPKISQHSKDNKKTTHPKKVISRSKRK